MGPNSRTEKPQEFWVFAIHFWRYGQVPYFWINDISLFPGGHGHGGHAQVTVLFCDIDGFEEQLRLATGLGWNSVGFDVVAPLEKSEKNKSSLSM